MEISKGPLVNISSFKNEKQRVSIHVPFLEWRGVNEGVLQGSVYGSELFHIFINNLQKGVNNELTKFANNTDFSEW